jgi:hypothetical protein
MNIARGILLVTLLAGLAACGSVFLPEPIGVGSDRDALKQSPCACDEILPDFSGWAQAG